MTILQSIIRALGCAEDQKEPVDVARMLDDMAAGAEPHLDWRHSVVDLMKLLGLDSSVSARRALAEDLRYRGEFDGPHMNQWLHQQIMHRVADNGGVVPPELL